MDQSEVWEKNKSARIHNALMTNINSLPASKNMPMPNNCIFCSSTREVTYSLNGFSISFCKRCKTSGVSQSPSSTDINDFYQGFNFQTDLNTYNSINAPEIKAWMQQLGLPKNAKMLDVGGGGGFFAKAFEEFGLGESTYIDLDSEACDFAKNQVGLERVISDSVENGENYFKGQKIRFYLLSARGRALSGPMPLDYGVCKAFI